MGKEPVVLNSVQKKRTVLEVDVGRDGKEVVGFGFGMSCCFSFSLWSNLDHVTENSGSWPRLFFMLWQGCTPVRFA